jgi:Spy/CpxP family protein refolding chaperone
LKALRPDFKAQGKIAKGDTAAMRKRWQENAPKREQAKQLMLAERSEIRGALTAENQAKFDANVQKMQERIAKRGERAKAHGKAPRSRTPGQN